MGKVKGKGEWSKTRRMVKDTDLVEGDWAEWSVVFGWHFVLQKKGQREMVKDTDLVEGDWAEWGVVFGWHLVLQKKGQTNGQRHRPRRGGLG